ncbi:hypothetical protein [Halalkalibacter alkaliphilus]|uniref:Uncharacterized protein n=1 Tax=Halalkalibacter alkaliphilus TaxID=2917993 RepID=A0A9X2CWI6_9BACI|nr:hypothetical protein [Halalkalibacter alkaliphilus]MCL7749584.1 hypothetical protein [Halalkalibacter alkaliphilus]
MIGIMQWIALYFMPFLCIAFVLSSVNLAKKIKNGDEDTGSNTAWVTVTFTLIIYSLVSVMI